MGAGIFDGNVFDGKRISVLVLISIVIALPVAGLLSKICLNNLQAGLI